MHSDWLPPNASPPPGPLALPIWIELLSGSLQAAAVDLRPQHVAEAGFHLEAALAVVDELAVLDWAILGGDVWDIADSIPKPAGLNWAAEKGREECWDEFVARAAADARDRISFFEDQGSLPTLYVLVASTEPQYHDLMRVKREL